MGPQGDPVIILVTKIEHFIHLHFTRELVEILVILVLLELMEEMEKLVMLGLRVHLVFLDQL